MARKYGIPVPDNPPDRAGDKLHIRLLTKDSLMITRTTFSDEFRLFL